MMMNVCVGSTLLHEAPGASETPVVEVWACWRRGRGSRAKCPFPLMASALRYMEIASESMVDGFEKLETKHNSLTIRRHPARESCVGGCVAWLWGEKKDG